MSGGTALTTCGVGETDLLSDMAMGRQRMGGLTLVGSRVFNLSVRLRERSEQRLANHTQKDCGRTRVELARLIGLAVEGERLLR